VSLVLVLIVSIVLHKSSPLYSLDFIVLTLNQFCGVKFKFYRITYSPPSRFSQKGWSPCKKSSRTSKRVPTLPSRLGGYYRGP
jgi:hypothetical protein